MAPTPLLSSGVSNTDGAPTPTSDAPPAKTEASKKSDFAAVLGRAAWTVLHALADEYPTNPSEEQKAITLRFLQDFSLVYPCEKCRYGFQEVMYKFPPDVSSKPAFVKWMSFFHDQINMQMGKPTQGSNHINAKAEALKEPSSPASPNSATPASPVSSVQSFGPSSPSSFAPPSSVAPLSPLSPSFQSPFVNAPAAASPISIPLVPMPTYAPTINPFTPGFFTSQLSPNYSAPVQVPVTSPVASSYYMQPMNTGFYPYSPISV